MSRSYDYDAKADPQKHKIYKSFLSQFTLPLQDFSNLQKRGLSPEQIQGAGYVTKASYSSNASKQAIGKMSAMHGNELKGVPGFFINEAGHRDMAKISGLMIPVRDCIGYIQAILVRNAHAKPDKTGKIKNKYIFFSSSKEGQLEGGKVYPSTHCPTIRGPAKKAAGTAIRVTEGILKADIATALDEEFYCLGIHGLNIPDDLAAVLVELEISQVRIVLDSGEADNSDMKRALAKLIRLILDLGHEVVVELWDPQYGKGIDDVLAAGHKDKIRLATDEEINAMLEAGNKINPNNGDWLYVVELEKFINTNNFQGLRKSQFADKMRLEDTAVVNNLIANGFPQVDSMTFLPKAELIVTEDGLRKLNEWRDPGLVPVEGDISILLAHIEYIFPDELQRNIFLDFVAFCLQSPGVKIHYMLVIYGEEGTGKSFFKVLLKILLGSSNVGTPSNEELHERFNTWQKGCQLIIIEELMSLGRRELMNALKPKITEASTRIREMHKVSYDYPNRYNMMAFTNHMNALKPEYGDRRYCVLKSEAKAQDDGYYNQLFGWLDDPVNMQAALHYFLSRDLSRFNPKARAPETLAKQEMIASGRSPLDEWVISGIEEECWPFNTGMAVTRHIKTLEACPRHLRSESDYNYAQALQKAGAQKFSKPVKLSDGSKVTIWLYGPRKDLLGNFGPAELAKYYENEVMKGKDETVNPLADSEPI